MRLCRYQASRGPAIAFYSEEGLCPIDSVAQEAGVTTPGRTEGADLLEHLPPDGQYHSLTKKLAVWLETAGESVRQSLRIPRHSVELLTPIPRPPKLLLLAGNYAKHVEERGRQAAERAETFPYVFMKPPSTTLTAADQSVRLPKVSPNHIDWELELGVVVGRRAKGVSEADALGYVAGYTIVNDLSDRAFRPNPGRKKRDRDEHFDWQHGKWHDGFCPCGPCVLAADAAINPQALRMQLRLNGEVRQDASTSQQIFPVAAVIEFLSSFVTLEPGDIISTGTPAGVGSASGTYLRPGDRLDGWIEGIGVLTTHLIADASSAS